MSSSIFCGPCQYEEIIKGAKKWCTDCEDGYCENCEKVHRSTKMSRNHTLISIADYQKIKDVSVKQNCEHHGKRFDLYCSTHDKALCIGCVNHHKSCADVTPLDEAARNAKESTAFADVENTINGALENITTCIKDQESTEKHVENQEQMIRENIKEIREKINKKLNILEQKLINDLSVISAKCKSSLKKTLNQLKSADIKLIQLKEETQKMKKFASDLQVFLGTREMNIVVAKEIETITRTINAALHFKIEAELDLNLSSLLNQADAMGKILLQEIPTNLRFKDAKIYQAQKQSSLLPERGFRELRLQIEQKLKIFKRKKNEINVTGCLILPNGHMLIAVLRRFDESHNSCLIEYNKEGNHINDIQLSKDPFDLTLIDSDRIAITYGKVLSYNKIISKYSIKQIVSVEIKNITHGSSNKIPVNTSCWGISHQDGRLYVIVEGESILVVDVSGNILNSLRINTCNAKYISTSKHIICYSEYSDVENSVHCCNMDGQEIWVFQLNSISICPAGLSVVHNNDICVVCCTSNNITLIHCDGTESKTLLTADDGLNEVKALHYDKHSKTLLVCDKTNYTLYKVV